MAISISKAAIPSVHKTAMRSADGVLSRFRDLSHILRQVDLRAVLRQKVPSRDVMFFTAQLSLMVETGTPVNTSVLAIAKQINNRAFQDLLNQIAAHLEEGLRLSDAMAKHPAIFSEVHIGLIRAGEATGQLREMLDRLVAFEKRRQGILFAVRSAMAYPLFLTLLSIGVITFILTYVFPKFGELFENIHDELPITTRVLLVISDVLRGYWPLIIVLVALIGGSVWLFVSSRRGKALVDRLVFSIPLVKEFLAKFYVSGLMRTLGALLGGGVVLLEALRVCRGLMTNSMIGRFVESAMENIQQGKTFVSSVNAAPFMPQMVKQMIQTGEETGNLPKVMGRVADYYDEELERDLKTFSTLLEPLLLVIMGAVVGLVVASLVLPIFKLTQSIH